MGGERPRAERGAPHQLCTRADSRGRLLQRVRTGSTARRRTAPSWRIPPAGSEHRRGHRPSEPRRHERPRPDHSWPQSGPSPCVERTASPTPRDDPGRVRPSGRPPAAAVGWDEARAIRCGESGGSSCRYYSAGTGEEGFTIRVPPAHVGPAPPCLLSIRDPPPHSAPPSRWDLRDTKAEVFIEVLIREATTAEAVQLPCSNHDSAENRESGGEGGHPERPECPR